MCLAPLVACVAQPPAMRGPCEQVVCPAGASCKDGVCVCGGATTRCDGACATLAYNVAHCGACGAACERGLVCNDGVCAAPPPSCIGLASNCGPDGNDSCCTSPLVPGGTFFRGYDVAGDAYSGSGASPATVSEYRLDRYEITVGRYRQFVLAFNAGWRPKDGMGANPYIARSGWNYDGTGWTLPASLTEQLYCDRDRNDAANWTEAAGDRERRPINCITWLEAMAFCAWDGGFLPTEAEWTRAASGGEEQRAYPWSQPAADLTIDCNHANIKFDGVPCHATLTRDVGQNSPTGNGRWGHADLAGNVWEWNLDRFGAAYPSPCVDCAYLVPGDARLARGGNFYDDPWKVRIGHRYNSEFGPRAGGVGARCARRPR